ncbi:MAG: HypC/HybG/HupF family hydrogenase formation chaperone [Candidatus Sumerlaeia bacterium]|nr:HypC/HybG/HupF family hydrogenase formation chaperone [Candidatus Sumerlaeia bacterium]
MCLGIPGRIEEIKGSLATVTFGTVRREVDIRLLDNVQVGDFVLVHAGFAINKINQQEAEATLELLRELASYEEHL